MNVFKGKEWYGRGGKAWEEMIYEGGAMQRNPGMVGKVFGSVAVLMRTRKTTREESDLVPEDAARTPRA